MKKKFSLSALLIFAAAGTVLTTLHARMEQAARDAQHARDAMATASALLAQDIAKRGITAFTGADGRDWSLSSYLSMAITSASHTATNAGSLFRDPSHDLYIVTSTPNPCAICAPLEGRVYSRSGEDTRFPPLTDLFTEMVDAGGDVNDLENYYLDIHNNCGHFLQAWYEGGKSSEAVESIQRHSSYAENPPTVDPRSQQQIDAYREKQRAQAKQYRAYRAQQRAALNSTLPLGD